MEFGVIRNGPATVRTLFKSGLLLLSLVKLLRGKVANKYPKRNSAFGIFVLWTGKCESILTS